jgi:hypothetical protein
MSLTTRHSSVLIGLPSRFADPTYPLPEAPPVLVNEEPSLTNEGWDSLTQIYTVRVATLTPEALAGLFPIGARLGSRNWWVVGSVPQERAPGFWTARVAYKGWAQSKPAIVKVSASAASHIGENVGVPSFTVGNTTYAARTVPKVETHQNTPNVTVSYLVADVGDAPKTALVGTQTSLPVSITAPSNIWASLDPYLFHFPNGWVLLESAEDRLPGSTAALVTDTYQFIQAISPG